MSKFFLSRYSWGPGVPGGRTSSPVLDNFVIFRQNVDDSDKSTRKNSPIGNQGDAFTLLPMTLALLKRRYSALDKLYIVEMFIVENHNRDITSLNKMTRKIKRRLSLLFLLHAKSRFEWTL